MQPTKKEIDIKDVQDKIRQAIRDQYDMSIYQFARSGVPEEWGLAGKNLSTYLSSGSVSFTALRTLYQHLGLGQLGREYKVVKQAVFYESED